MLQQPLSFWIKFGKPAHYMFRIQNLETYLTDNLWFLGYSQELKQVQKLCIHTIFYFLYFILFCFVFTFVFSCGKIQPVSGTETVKKNTLQGN